MNLPLSYRLVPERNETGEETGYYTREPDGVSGMTVTALAEFCGTRQQTVTQILNRIRDSDPITNDLLDCLKPFAGGELRLITNDLQGRLIIPDDACHAIAEYYAFEAREYPGKPIALRNFRAVGRPGMRVFIWSRTGYVPPSMRQPQRGPYWYERMKLALSDNEKPLQIGYFCIYQEMMGFFCELETRFGFIMPDINLKTGQHLVPDISIAKRFNMWLRNDEDEVACIARRHFLGSAQAVDFRPARKTQRQGRLPEGRNHREIQFYNHVYPKSSHGNYQVQQACSYPDRYQSIFKYYLQEYWIPDHCATYLIERDSEGVMLMMEAVNQMSPAARAAIDKTLVGRLVRSLTPLISSSNNRTA
jgi:hypothetical protein